MSGSNPQSVPNAVESLDGFPNLKAILAGTVSGHHTEWPMVRQELIRLLARPNSDAPAHPNAVEECLRLAIRQNSHDMLLTGDEIRRCEAALQSFRPNTNAFEASFREAVIDALIVNHIYRKEHDTDPKMALNDLICWEQKLALDPLVSEEAEALVERGRQEVRPNREPSFGDWWRNHPFSKSNPELYGICEAVWLAARSATQPNIEHSIPVTPEMVEAAKTLKQAGYLTFPVSIGAILRADPSTPSATEAQETGEERRLRHRLEKIDAALDDLGAPKTEVVDGLTMELSRVGRIRRLAAMDSTAKGGGHG